MTDSAPNAGSKKRPNGAGAGLPVDQAARDRIAGELNTTFLVEAGAGSGKTTSLVGRLVRLIRTGTAEIGQLAAITFTNKAADEMKERFRIELEKQAREEPAGSEEQVRLFAALERLEACFIGTIHAFCGSLLRERPVEAGLDPSFAEMDEEADQAFRDRCWDDFMQRLQENGEDGPLRELIELGVDVNTLRQSFHRVSLFTDVAIPAEPAERPDVDRIRLSLLPLIDEAYPYLPTLEPDKGWDKLQEKLRAARQQAAYSDYARDDMAALRLAQLFDAKLDVTLNRWTDKAMAKSFKERFQEWQIQVLFPFLTEWREYLYPKLIGFVLPALEEAGRRRREAGLLNFQDLLMKAAALLRENAEVRRYFAQRYRRLLVDEFQDTDPIQAEMMFLLTGDAADPNERDWRKMTPRPGSLFVVGDPKQSIYRFRRADISIYNEVKARIAACGDVLQLTANFRSVVAVGAFVNSQFVGKLPPRETAFQAAYVSMATMAPNPGGGGKKNPAPHHGVFALSYPKLPGGKAAVALADSERIARYIADACLRGESRPEDFLVLTKTREFIHLYAEQLERYGIPAETSGGSALYAEIRALALLAQTLGDPADRVALLAVLRGMLFGISDAALAQFKREGHAFSLFAPPEEADAGSALSLSVVRALRTLRRYAGWVRRLPALAALRRIVEDTGLLSYATVQDAGSARAGTLIKLLQSLQQDPLTASGWLTLAERLRESAEGRGPEASSLYAGGGSAVRVMNLHKAKGLEAPVVFLACPCGESDHDADQYVDRSTDPAKGYFTISQKRGEFHSEIIAQPAGWAAMNEREREFANAEKVRLLYVAATRAKRLLVVSLYPEQPARCPWTALMEGMDLTRELDVPAETDPTLLAREEAAEPARFGGEAAGSAGGSSGGGGEAVYGGLVGGADGEGDFGGSLPAASDPAAFFEARRQRLAAMERPTFARISVTRQTKNGSETSGRGLPAWSAEGRGQAFGSVVHRALEAVGQGGIASPAELAPYVQWLSDQEELAAEHRPAAVETVRGVLGSELWQRARRAKRRLHEVHLTLGKRAEALAALRRALRGPDAAESAPGGGAGDAGAEIAAAGDSVPGDPSDGADSGAADSGSIPGGSIDGAVSRDSAGGHVPGGGAGLSAVPADTILKGVIDFLFEEEDGWVIVDFKTDHVSPGQLDSFVRFYRPQVRAYADEWAANGFPVKEAGLYFTHTQQYVVLGEEQSAP